MENKKIAMITGVTSGIGFATANELIKQGFEIIGVYRSEKKRISAEKSFENNCHFIKGDLSSQSDIREIAKSTKEYLNSKGLDVLINNAGAFFSHYKLSDDGVEMQFAINTIAPHLLSVLLFDSIKKANGRIINVSSSSHYKTKIKFTDMQLSKNYSQLRAYKQTKLLSVILSREFNKHSKDVKMYMADPGLVNTEIGFKNTYGIAKFIWKYRKNKGQTPEQGANTTVHLATASSFQDNLYWKNATPQKPNPNALKDNDAIIVWNYAQKICGIKFEDYMR